MFDNLKTLIIDGKKVTSLSINDKIVWRASTNTVPRNVLRTVNNKMFMTADGRYFVVEVEETTNGRRI